MRRRLPWWLTVSGVFILGRLASTAMLLVLAANQGDNPWTHANPSLWDFSSLWDGRWYNIIATAGYPAHLPLGDNGHVAENAWAFLPAYPFLVRGLMALTGLPWNVVAVAVSVLCAWGATLVLYRMLQRVVPHQQALFAVVLFSVSPVSPLFQLAYAESMQLFLLALILYFVMARRYAAIIPTVLVLGFTRPGAIAVALLLLLHVILRFVGRARHRFPASERWWAAAAIVASVVAGFAWLVAAAVVTGNLTAYLDTELAWRSVYIGYQQLVPFTPWLLASQWWMPGLTGYVVLGLLVLGFVVLLLTPAARKLGADLRLWLVSYALYLLAVFFPQSSTFRLLAPLFPAAGILAAPTSKVYRVLAVLVSLALQWWWLTICWAVVGSDWTPP
jgi:hypothetical protein